MALELRWPRMKGSSHQRLGGWRRVGRESLGYKGHPALRVPPYYPLTVAWQTTPGTLGTHKYRCGIWRRSEHTSQHEQRQVGSPSSQLSCFCISFSMSCHLRGERLLERAFQHGRRNEALIRSLFTLYFSAHRAGTLRRREGWRGMPWSSQPTTTLCAYLRLPYSAPCPAVLALNPPARQHTFSWFTPIIR